MLDRYIQNKKNARPVEDRRAELKKKKNARPVDDRAQHT